MTPDVPLVPLATPVGVVPIPQLGFGVWRVGDADAEVAVSQALAAGYRHVDTATLYGNESGVGRALATSGLAREEVFLTSKVWNDSHGRAAARAEFAASLDRLGTDCLDLYLIHWPCPALGRYVETWQALQELRDEGRVRAIGVSNFTPRLLAELHAATGEWPALNQVELHPYLQQAPLRAFHAEHGIVTEAWAPLARGKELLDDPVVGAIATARDWTPAQVVLAWHLTLGVVAIPKSVTPARIVTNLAAAAYRLTPEELQAMATLERDGRTGMDPETFSDDLRDRFPRVARR